MWLWHCAEEFEHKNTAFDVYAALGGSYEWRIKWFRRISLIFLSDTLRQTVNNLSPDGRLWQWRTWKSAASFLLGQRGLIRQTFQLWRAYLRKDFHSSRQSSSLSAPLVVGQPPGLHHRRYIGLSLLRPKAAVLLSLLIQSLPACRD